MLRKIALGAGLVFATGLIVQNVNAQGVGGKAYAESACGDPADHAKSKRAEDLPVCETSAQRDLREARSALVHAERQLNAESTDQVAHDVSSAEAVVQRLTAQERKGGQLAQWLPLYRRAALRIRARALLVPELDGLRACQAQTQVLLRGASEGPTAASAELASPDLRAAQVQIKRVEECVDLLRRILTQHPVQDSLSDGLALEFAPGQNRPLHDLVTDVHAAHRAALGQRQGAQQAWEVVRGRWLRVLFGDRLRVFNAHPGELPEYDGKARGPLPASAVPRWRYRTPDGKVEMYLFRKNRLVSKVVEDQRRS